MKTFKVHSSSQQKGQNKRSSNINNNPKSKSWKEHQANITPFVQTETEYLEQKKKRVLEQNKPQMSSLNIARKKKLETIRVDPAYLNAKDEVQTGEKPLPFCL